MRTPLIDTTCKKCDEQAAFDNIIAFLAYDKAHVCKAAPIIRKAIAHYEGTGTAADALVADSMRSLLPDVGYLTVDHSFSHCDDPGAVKQAIKVGLVLAVDA